MNLEIYKKIIAKREFSQLPKKDVELAFSKFEKMHVSDEEKIRATREVLNKIYWPFRSRKLLTAKNKPVEWVLRKHLSTRERLGFYKKLYKKLIDKNYAIFDLGAGINGISFNYFPKKIKYFGIEAVGQFVELMNYYFEKNKLNGEAIHLSLFEFERIKCLIKNQKGNKIVFLFKVLDSLEMLEKNYSKKLLLELVPLVDKVVVSFPTRSMISGKKFKVQRNWLVNFLKQNFKITDDFELGSERYFIFKNN